MANILSADHRMQILQNSLSGLSQRQRLIANNLANIDTPGYRSFDVPFEQVLERTITNGPDLPLQLTSAGHIGAPSGTMPSLTAVQSPSVLRTDGNGVDVDAEMAKLSETVIQFNAVTQLLSAKLAILQSAATEGRR
ncbi:MAG: flagellar basal body rod protein FlgB [Chloroflexota bacterium]|jgi:flagellar basal-body rod protein FlgB